VSITKMLMFVQSN